MLKRLLLLTIFTFLFSQAEIINIQASQRTDGSQIVDITYDLLEDELFEIFEIFSEVSFDNGISYFPLLYVDGDIGPAVNSGNSKHFTWHIGSQYPNQFSENLIIRLTAESTITSISPFNMIEIDTSYYGCGIGQEIDYNYDIMEKNVTNAQYAEFLITLLNDGLMNPDSPYEGYYEGDLHFLEGYYLFFKYWHGYPDYGIPSSAINWNGTTFIVEEGRGDEAVFEATWFGAMAFANYYGLRIPTENEIRKADPYIVKDYVNWAGSEHEWISDWSFRDDYPCDQSDPITCSLYSIFGECSVDDTHLDEFAHFRCVGN